MSTAVYRGFPTLGELDLSDVLTHSTGSFYATHASPSPVSPLDTSGGYGTSTYEPSTITVTRTVPPVDSTADSFTSAYEPTTANGYTPTASPTLSPAQSFYSTVDKTETANTGTNVTSVTNTNVESTVRNESDEFGWASIPEDPVYWKPKPRREEFKGYSGAFDESGNFTGGYYGPDLDLSLSHPDTSRAFDSTNNGTGMYSSAAPSTASVNTTATASTVGSSKAPSVFDNPWVASGSGSSTSSTYSLTAAANAYPYGHHLESSTAPNESSYDFHSRTYDHLPMEKTGQSETMTATATLDPTYTAEDADRTARYKPHGVWQEGTWEPPESWANGPSSPSSRSYSGDSTSTGRSLSTKASSTKESMRSFASTISSKLSSKVSGYTSKTRSRTRDWFDRHLSSSRGGETGYDQTDGRSGRSD